MLKRGYIPGGRGRLRDGRTYKSAQKEGRFCERGVGSHNIIVVEKGVYSGRGGGVDSGRVAYSCSKGVVYLPGIFR